MLAAIYWALIPSWALGWALHRKTHADLWSSYSRLSHWNCCWGSTRVSISPTLLSLHPRETSKPHGGLDSSPFLSLVLNSLWRDRSALWAWNYAWTTGWGTAAGSHFSSRSFDLTPGPVLPSSSPVITWPSQYLCDIGITRPDSCLRPQWLKDTMLAKSLQVASLLVLRPSPGFSGRTCCNCVHGVCSNRRHRKCLLQLLISLALHYTGRLPFLCALR